MYIQQMDRCVSCIYKEKCQVDNGDLVLRWCVDYKMEEDEPIPNPDYRVEEELFGHDNQLGI